MTAPGQDPSDEAGHVLDAAPRLAAKVRRLAARRMVFFAGLPGTGKSLLVHQLARVAARRDRWVHLLQWDVARPVFEASPAGRRYPLVDGVTHAIIRKAAGLWVRHAVAAWSQAHPGEGALLVGETPFAGNRFVELARRHDDGAEPVLAAPSCRFVITVPSPEVRRFVEAERERRAAHPLHGREREDAPPRVLRELWRDLARVARAMGVFRSEPEPAGQAAPGGTDGGRGSEGDVPYDPVAYRRVYERVLRHRHVDVVDLDLVLPTAGFSVYDLGEAPLDLVPTPEEAEAFVHEAERRYPDPTALEREIARWWEV